MGSETVVTEKPTSTVLVMRPYAISKQRLEIFKKAVDKFIPNLSGADSTIKKVWTCTVHEWLGGKDEAGNVDGLVEVIPVGFADTLIKEHIIYYVNVRLFLKGEYSIYIRKFSSGSEDIRIIQDIEGL